MIITSTLLSPFPSARHARAHVARLLAEAVPVSDWGLARSPQVPTGTVPVLLLDGRRRPDVHRMLAAQPPEGAHACTRWEVLPQFGVAVLDVTLRGGSDGRFHLFFWFDRHARLLHELLDAQVLGLQASQAYSQLTLARARRTLLVPCVREPLGNVFGAWASAEAVQARRN